MAAKGAGRLNGAAGMLAVVGLALVFLAPQAREGDDGRARGSPGSSQVSTGGPASAPGGGDAEARDGFRTRVAALEHAVEAAPDDRARVLELARVLHDGHRLEEAVPLYRRAVELDPDEPSAVYDLSTALLFLGRRREAREALEAHLDRVPGDATTLYNLGAVLASGGDGAGARLRWTQALEASPDPALRARIERGLATLGARGPP